MAQSVTFFDRPEPISLVALAERCQCKLRDGDDGSLNVSSVGPIEAAPEGCLTFLSNSQYLKAVAKTNASAVICSLEHADSVPKTIAVLISDKPYQSFSMAMGIMFPNGLRPLPLTGETGLSPAAHIHSTARIEDNVIVEAGAVIGPDVAIGSGSLIGPNAVIGAGVQIGRSTSVSAGASIMHSIIGDDVIIHAGVRLGGDGFGFSMGPGGHLKIPQVGRVVIQDKVEIGSNSTIDRGANRDTIIGEGTKIDNLVMIGHNVVVGRHCVIVAQVGIAGSTELGDYVVLGGKAAVNGHLKIGDGAQIAGRSGVLEDVPPGVQWGGFPARPINHWMRDVVRKKREASLAVNKDKKQ